MMNSITLGSLICQARKKQGLKQEELALLANTGVRFIVDAEKGKETCQVGKILKLLEILHLELAVVKKREEE